MLNVTLKLLIVFLLPILGQDKLIVYASLVLGVSILIIVIYRVYCIKNYCESHFSIIYNKSIILPMLSFSGWDLYGNMAVSWRQQGMNFLINMFFGPVLNAASSIATTVQGIVIGLSGNVTMAYRPQIIKSYACQNYEQVNNLLHMAVRFTLGLFLLVAIPVFIEIETVLKLWLGIVPKYTADFFRLIMISNVFGLVNGIIIIPIHASGRIKQLSFLTGSLFLFSLVPMYVALKFGFSPISIYWTLVIFSVLILIADFYLLKKNVSNIKIFPIIFELLKAFILVASVFFMVEFFKDLFSNRIMRLLSNSFISVFLYSIGFFIFQLSNEQRRTILKRIFKEKNG